MGRLIIEDVAYYRKQNRMREELFELEKKVKHNNATLGDRTRITEINRILYGE